MSSSAPKRSIFRGVQQFIMRVLPDGQMDYICTHCYRTVQLIENEITSETLTTHQRTCMGRPPSYPTRNPFL